MVVEAATFGRVLRRSVQWIQSGHLVEEAGPVRVTFQVSVSNATLQFQSVRTRLLGIPLPVRVTGSVRGTGSSWEFEVRIASVGSYRGVMEPTL